MLLPVTLLEGGKTNKTVVKMIYAEDTCRNQSLISKNPTYQVCPYDTSNHPQH